MNTLTTSNFRSNDVRTVTDEHGEPWFVAKDVCDALDYLKDTSAVLTAHVDDDDRRPLNLNTLPNREPIRGNPRVSVINESGLYSLILSSKKPEAREFRKWVTSEVLPSIRKHGGYVAKSAGETPPDGITKRHPHLTREMALVHRGIS